MSFTVQQEREILTHIKSLNNPHQITTSQVGLNTSDELVEGRTNKFAAPYTIDPHIKEVLEQRYGIVIDLDSASTTEVFNLIFELLYRG